MNSLFSSLETVKAKKNEGGVNSLFPSLQTIKTKKTKKSKDSGPGPLAILSCVQAV